MSHTFAIKTFVKATSRSFIFQFRETEFLYIHHCVSLVRALNTIIMLRRMASARRHKLSESPHKKTGSESKSQSPHVETIVVDSETVVEKEEIEAEPRTVPREVVKETHDFSPCEREEDHKKQEEELFEMYKEFMVDTFVEHGAKQGCQKPRKEKRHGQDAPVAQPTHKTMPTKGAAYVKQLSQKRSLPSSNRKKATGVTRRHMEENNIARENMFIFRRLQQISPSVTIDRRYLKRDFIKSRHYLEKMSRYESYESQPRPSAPVWVI